MKLYDWDRFPKKLIYILAVGFILRLYLSQFLTYYPDLYTYQLWSLDVIRYGFSKFYNVSVSDYLPGYIYILWFFGKIYYFINAKLFYVPAEFVFKLPSIFTDLGNAAFIYCILRGKVSEKAAFWVTLAYYLNPAFIFNSTIWGQSESIVMFFLLGSVYFLAKGDFTISSLFLVLGQITKPIVVLILPLNLVYIYLKKRQIWPAISYSLFFLVIYILLFVPFSDRINLLGFVWQRNIFTSGFWDLTNLNAFNFWGLISILSERKLGPVKDLSTFLVLDYHTWGIILFLIFYLTVVILSVLRLKSHHNRIETVLSGSALIYLGMFHLLTRMHERHIYYGLVFLILITAFNYKNKIQVFLAGSLTAIFLTDMLYSYNAASIISFSLPIFAVASLSLLSVFALGIFTVLILGGRNK